MQKIVIGFPLSHEAIMRYGELKGIKLHVYVHPIDENGIRFDGEKGCINFDIFEEYDPTKHINPFSFYYSKEPLDKQNHLKSLFFQLNFPRDDTLLVQTVEELGKKAGYETRVVEIPDDVKWTIEETSDGHEWVDEKHRTWS